MYFLCAVFLLIVIETFTRQFREIVRDDAFLVLVL